MSLYYDAAAILEDIDSLGGSLKSRIFGNRRYKSDEKTVFALCTETTKWSSVLKEVIESSGLLEQEKQLDPVLAILLTHDLLLARGGVACAKNNGLSVAIRRHKARLSAELIRVRVKRGCATELDLRKQIEEQAAAGLDGGTPRPPRWVRINTLKTSLEDQLKTTFSSYLDASLEDVMRARPLTARQPLHQDEHIPDLIALPGFADLSKDPAYLSGRLILQDKASCFPAYLLNPKSGDSDLLDACAAPGNKTSHLAALSAKAHTNSLGCKIYACERDPTRSQALLKMLGTAGAMNVVVMSGQDFLMLNPRATDFRPVTGLLLDPSCSGSGFVNRDNNTGPTLHVPERKNTDPAQIAGKKRKRKPASASPQPSLNTLESEADVDPAATADKDQVRLQARLDTLSTIQLKLLLHAFSFPGARKITYSTCSIHAEENEYVVMKALFFAQGSGMRWRVLRRNEQVDGMRKWQSRGDPEACKRIFELFVHGAGVSSSDVADACIRCDKGTADGTMGFFVAGFVRDRDRSSPVDVQPSRSNGMTPASAPSEEEWNGFGDGDNSEDSTKVPDGATCSIGNSTSSSTDQVAKRSKRKHASGSFQGRTEGQ